MLHSRELEPCIILIARFPLVSAEQAGTISHCLRSGAKRLRKLVAEPGFRRTIVLPDAAIPEFVTSKLQTKTCDVQSLDCGEDLQQLGLSVGQEIARLFVKHTNCQFLDIPGAPTQ
jgi:hypothetical protein